MTCFLGAKTQPFTPALSQNKAAEVFCSEAVISKGASLGPWCMALKGVRAAAEVYWVPPVTMAKWFKEFPINLKNGTDRTRSSSESGSQPRAHKAGLMATIGTKTCGPKPGQRKNSSSDNTGGGVGSLLSGKNRKNSDSEASRSGGEFWDTLLSGKSRKNSKAEPVFEEQHRPLKSSPSASAYINRLIRVDKQDKGHNYSSGSASQAAEAENPAQGKAETVSRQTESARYPSLQHGTN